MEINGKVKAGIVALVIAAGAFGGWQYYQSSQKAGKAAQVQTVDVKRHDLKSTVSATGTLRPHE